MRKKLYELHLAWDYAMGLLLYTSSKVGNRISPFVYVYSLVFTGKNTITL